jgi:hypothetical protein
MGFDTSERQYKALIPGHGFIKSTDMKFDNFSNLDVVPLLPLIPSDFNFKPVADTTNTHKLFTTTTTKASSNDTQILKPLPLPMTSLQPTSCHPTLTN